MADGITISIDDRELQKAISDVKSWETKKIRKIQRVVMETVVNIDRKSKKFVPVLSGRLRSSIRWRLSGDKKSGQIFTNVNYAAFVEFGTTKQRKQPYMRPAALLEQRSYIQKMTQALRSA